MKLLNIKIDGFGKFINYSFSFDSSIVVIEEDNSFGKTTIAEFIKAMFYGLPSMGAKKRTRAIYKPWDTHNFGGELTFELNGDKYTVIRSFKNTPSTDTFRLFDHKRKVDIDELLGITLDKNGKNFGEVIFGINESSFERINFIGQLDARYFEDKNELHSDINKKLRELYGDTADDNDFTNAFNALNKTKREIDPSNNRKDTKYNQNETRINELNRLINGAHDASEILVKEEMELEEAKKAKKENDAKTLSIEQNLALIGKKEKLELELETTNKLIKEKEKLDNELTEVKIFFNHTDISKINLKELKEAKDKYKKEEQNLKDFKESKAKESKEIIQQKLESSKSSVKKVIVEEKLTDIKKNIDEIKKELEELRLKLKPITIGVIILSIITFSIYYFIFKARNRKVKDEIISFEKKLNELGAELSEKETELNELEKSDINLELEQQEQENEKLVTEKENTFKNLKESVFALFKSYKIATDNIELAYNLVEINYNRYLALIKEIENKEKELAKYNLDKIKEELTKFDDLDKEELEKEKIIASKTNNELIKGINTLEHNIEENYELVSNLEIYEVELEDLKERRLKFDKKRDLLEITTKLLEEANQRLAAKYLNPLEEKVNQLIKKFDLDELSVTFDGNSLMKVKPSKTHEPKDFDNFSTGNKDLMSILVRIGLIDIIYENNHPFIIFDDSFAYFDDKKILKVKELLERLSKNYQIIYFTCSSSRNLNHF
ncbi:MAG: hypothetical protein QM205_01665 [Bacillota bacterium]|nr:hypothetical protein [Bacillota bacterium]